MIQKERKDYEREIQQQRLQLQQQIQASQEFQRPISQNDNESKESLDLPVLSRQSTQNTLESIPSIRNMPTVTRQSSQMSIPSISSGFNTNFNDDSVDPGTQTLVVLTTTPDTLMVTIPVTTIPVMVMSMDSHPVIIVMKPPLEMQ